MDIKTQCEQGCLDITFSGQFTFNDHHAFREILVKIEDPTVQQLVIHMAQVTFVDSAALGMLLLALDECKKQQKPMTLKHANGQVRKMFEMANFSSLFIME